MPCVMCATHYGEKLASCAAYNSFVQAGPPFTLPPLVSRTCVIALVLTLLICCKYCNRFYLGVFGNVKENVLPRPWLFVTQIRPPCPSTIAFVTYKPSPM